MTDIVETFVRESRVEQMFAHIDACPSPCTLEGVIELQADAKRVPIREALRVAVIAKHTPKYGKPLGRDVLAGARSCKFDADSWMGKPRYRLVYDVLPGHVVRVLAIGPREGVYPTAVNRATALQDAAVAGGRVTFAIGHVQGGTNAGRKNRRGGNVIAPSKLVLR